MNSNRIVYCDVLKILASIAVVLIHVCSNWWYALAVKSKSWMVINIFDSLCRWAVPVFLMVSGILLLKPEKDITIKEVFVKYIKKAIVLIAFWEVVFAFAIQINSSEQLNITTVINRLVQGHYHLWYLYMIIGIYLVTPIIKQIVNGKNEKVLRYFLALWLVFQILIPTINNILDIYIKDNLLKVMIPKLEISVISGYVGYYVLGYYLNEKKFSKKQRIMLYCLGFVSSLMTIFLTKHYEKSQLFYVNFSATTFLQSVAVIVFIKEICLKTNITEKLKKNISKIASLTLGIYVIHPVFIEIIKSLEVELYPKHIVMLILPITVGVYFFSMCVTYILSKIPILGKYIV